MRNSILLLLLLCFVCYPTITQDFPDGLIAYTPHEECNLYCINRILIVDPNTGETTEIDAGHRMVNGETLAWSAEQRYLLYFTGDFKAYIADAQMGKNVGEITFFHSEAIIHGVWYDWHPTMPLIAFTYISDFEPETPHYSLHLFDMTTQQWLPLVEDLTYIRPSSLRWSPDGKKILFNVGKNNDDYLSDIYIYDIAKQSYSNITNTPAEYGYSDWAGDSQRIVHLIGTEVFIFNTQTGLTETVYDFGKLRIGGAEWALNDTAILIWTHDTRNQGNDIELYLIDLEDKSPQLVLEVPPYYSGHDISPDGTAVVYLASETHPKEVCIVSLITFEETCLDSEKAYMISYPAWEN